MTKASVHRKTVLLLSILAAFMTPGGMADAECVNYADWLHWCGAEVIPGYPRRIDVENGWAYVTNGTSGLAIVDVSDTHAPNLVTTLDTPGSCLDVRVEGNHAFIADGSAGLLVVDVSAPWAPVIVDSLPGYARYVDTRNGRAVVAGGSLVRLLDIGMAPDVNVIGSVTVTAKEIRLTDSLIVAGGADSLRVIDIRNPAEPQVVGRFPVASNLVSLDVEGNVAYFVDTPIIHHLGYLRIIDLSNPYEPVQTGLVSFQLGGFIEVVGSLVYMTGTWAGSGVDILDVSNPADVEWLEPLFGTSPAELVFDDGFLYTTGYSSQIMEIFDVSPLDPAPVVATYVTSATSDLVLTDGLAWLCRDWGSSGRFEIVDISTPESPSMLGSLPLRGAHMEVSGNLAFLASGVLSIVDGSNPSAPALVRQVDTPGVVEDVALSGGYAFVADRNAGLAVIDVSVPASASVVAQLPMPDYAEGISILGTTAYVGTGDPGLTVVDISNPLSPSIITTMNTPGWAVRMAIHGNVGYLDDSGGGTGIFDLSNPSAPVLVRSVPIFARSWAFEGGFAYASQPFDGLLILDMTDPFDLRVVGGHAQIGENAVAVSDDYIFGCDPDLRIAHLPCVPTGVPERPLPTVPVAPSPFPNPSRGPVTIPAPPAFTGDMTVHLTDAAGRLVRTWTSVDGGPALIWDGRDESGRIVPAGTYFVRFTAEDRQSVRRIVRLR